MSTIKIENRRLVRLARLIARFYGYSSIHEYVTALLAQDLKNVSDYINARVSQEATLHDLGLSTDLSEPPMATLKYPTCGRVKIPRRQVKVVY
ncbi:MAG: hypothetical protein JRI79_14385 [Deltaproteobacteria bacterium]|nr:hypothetical protein [Deltaproteobacteria bacterium]MBW1979134.1 hypothetical protein [Deltaproteobacteria bacterium]MBW2046768.1 hypothetical protein [Deltaproteobacteria bacterium]MBW2301896.1 hypothetical protein [Deltaproteobacteria bacterium]